VLAELSRLEGVRLVSRGSADVWLASGHAEPPDGRPLVVQVHEIGWHDPELRSFLHPDFATLMESSTRAALDVAARVITPSEAARRQVIEAYSWPADRVHAVHHGVDHHLFRPGLAGGRKLVGGPYVLFVAVLHPRKNFMAVRQAVAGLARRGLPHVVAIVGAPARDRPDASEFERQAEAELPGLPGRVVRLRDVREADLAALMAGADAFCLPSFYEGFGLPVLEAMACGAAVVVSNRGAMPEVVGESGLVVEPEPAAVEHALHRLLTDPDLASRLRRSAAERAAGFTWERTATGWMGALRAAV
jgi:glycosyltransferase involved in cell wall biosynthesis